MRKYHEKLQDNTEEEDQDMPRQDQIRSTLSFIPDTQHLEKPENTLMNQRIGKDLVLKAIKLTKKGIVTGQLA